MGSVLGKPISFPKGFQSIALSSDDLDGRAEVIIAAVLVEVLDVIKYHTHIIMSIMIIIRAAHMLLLRVITMMRSIHVPTIKYVSRRAV